METSVSSWISSRDLIYVCIVEVLERGEAERHLKK